MELFDYLTDEDRKTIQEWIEINKHCSIGNLNKVLREWNKNNKTLFKMLGNKLRHKVPVELEIDKLLYHRELKEIYEQPHFVGYIGEEYPALSKEGTHNEFIEDLFRYILSFNFYRTDNFSYQSNDLIGEYKLPHWESGYRYNLITSLEYLFSHMSIIQGYTSYSFLFHFKNKKPLEIKDGTKPIRAIQKFLKYIEYPNMHLFENWRNALSNLSTKSRIKANLVLSIHPIDFLTLSDNNSGWSSCVRMQNVNVGAYASALTEMLNSNCVIVAYLESNHNKFIFNFNEIPNKSWRQLFVCHKDIICAGKSYPYTNHNLSKKILEILRDLNKENLNRTYQYGPQNYADMHARTQRAARINNYSGKDKHNIIFYTYGYYNDFVVDEDIKYFCLRNYVPKGKKICISGPATCLVCGDRLQNIDDIFYMSIEDIAYAYHNSICRGCRDKRCGVCGLIHSPDSHRYMIPFFTEYPIPPRTVCDMCINDVVLVKDKTSGKNIFFKDRRDLIYYVQRKLCSEKYLDIAVPMKGNVDYDQYEVSNCHTL